MGSSTDIELLVASETSHSSKIHKNLSAMWTRCCSYTYCYQHRQSRPISQLWSILSPSERICNISSVQEIYIRWRPALKSHSNSNLSLIYILYVGRGAFDVELAPLNKPIIIIYYYHYRDPGRHQNYSAVGKSHVPPLQKFYHNSYLLILRFSRTSRHIGQQLDAIENDPSQCVQPLSTWCWLSSGLSSWKVLRHVVLGRSSELVENVLSYPDNRQ